MTFHERKLAMLDAMTRCYDNENFTDLKEIIRRFQILYGWTLVEVAEHLGISENTLRIKLDTR